MFLDNVVADKPPSLRLFVFNTLSHRCNQTVHRNIFQTATFQGCVELLVKVAMWDGKSLSDGWGGGKMWRRSSKQQTSVNSSFHRFHGFSPPRTSEVPKRDIFGQNGPFGEPSGAQKGPYTRSKCVVTMNPTQAGQLGAVGTESAPGAL